MSLLADLKILGHLAFKPVRGATHQERLDRFYAGQAKGYDDFRRRLLAGRAELYQSLPALPGGVWLDLGGGTGANLEHVADRLSAMKKVYVIDLSESLLAVARERIAARRWTNVEAILDDVTRFVPAEGCTDLITFSYSLTMIPDWFAAIDHALSLLRPGGLIGVVDFYVSRKYPTPGLCRHRWWMRTLWPAWFALDNVHLSPDHLPYLRDRFETIAMDEGLSRVPYLAGARVPYYRFIGRKAAGTTLHPYIPTFPSKPRRICDDGIE